MQTAERYGQGEGEGEGEGTLALTDQRILFAFDRPIQMPFMAISRKVIVEVESAWTPYPGMRGLALVTEIDGRMIPSGFYLGKGYAKELVEELGPPN